MLSTPVARRRPLAECCDGTVRALRDLVAAVKRQLQPFNTGQWFRGGHMPRVALAFIQQANTSINNTILDIYLHKKQLQALVLNKYYVYMPGTCIFGALISSMS